MDHYTLVRSRRKTIAIEITEDAEVLVRAPMHASKREIEKFLLEKYSWIEKHRARVLDRMEAAREQGAITYEDMKKLGEEALSYIPKRVSYYAGLVGVTYGRITIRNQRTRWGSCSTKGNLNFNCLLMLAPEEVRDYVIVHELCHRIEMNHSKKFWSEVERVLPDYRERKKWLSTHGESLLARARAGAER